ncbi:BRCA1-associated RING domain protein 1-like [Babylonia areolata]|uniref:BRCA1-associated RING domain protein 1-like n=1 Tax=Babylonia areolata TaxID=304850 RepID=UPI003FD6B1AD
MEVDRAVSEFTATKHALASLQRLLLCCQCEQLTRNVCTLGNCEHFFCKQCVEERLGEGCPVCDTPAHARDAQVNKQLSNIVSVSLELSRLMKQSLDFAVVEKGKDQEDEESSGTSLTPQDDVPEEDTADPTSTNTYDQDVSAAKNKLQAPGSSEQHQEHSPQRVATRRDKRKKNSQTTLTQVWDEQLSDEPDETGTRNDAYPQNGKNEKTSAPQTRTNKRQKYTSLQTRSGPCVEDPESLTSVDETQTGRVDLTSEAGSSPACTNKQRRRPNQGCSSKATPKKTPEAKNASKGRFKTPTPPRSGRRHSGALQSNGIISAPPTPNINEDGMKMNTSHALSSASRRRSAPVLPMQMEPGAGQATPQKRRKTMSPRPSPVHRTKVPPPVGASPASKSGNRRSSDGITGRVKRNAKGETPLHVAAIKGDITAVRELLNKGDNPNVRDNAGWTPLHEAVNHGHTAVTEALLQHGAMVNMPGMENDTPLHDAVLNHRLDCVRLLVTYGASTTARNVHGQTALEVARTDDMRAALLQSAVQRPVVTTLPEPEDAEEFRPLCFLGTALSRDQRGLLQKCATKLHAKVVEDYCPEVTHVVSSVNADGQCPRTLKYLHAILGGKWIVSIDWVSVCLEYGQKVSEEPFEVPGSSTHPNSAAPSKARVNRKLQLPGLFDGCQIYLHGSFTRLPPSRAELSELLHLGGARLLTREPRLANLDEYDITVPYHAEPGSNIADCGVFIIHDGSSKAPAVHAQRMRSVPSSWVTECIATFSLPEPGGV